MNIKLFRIMLILIIPLFLFSCSQDNPAGSPEETSRATIIIDENWTETRSITPSDYSKPGFVQITLTNKDDPSTKYEKEFETNTNTFTFDSIKIGSYSVSVLAYDKDESLQNIARMKGESLSSNPLVVTVTGSNTTTLGLSLITSGDYTGSLEVKFDWKSAMENNTKLKNANENGLKIQMRLTKPGSNEPYTYTYETTPNETSYIITQDNIAVSPCYFANFFLYDSEGYYLGHILSSTLQIAANNISTVDSGHETDENGYIALSPDDISEALNVYDVAWAYGEDPESQIKITWKNRTYSDNWTKSVTLSWGKYQEGKVLSENSTTIEYNSATEDGSFVINNLTPGERMFITIQSVNSSDNAKSPLEYFYFDDNPMMTKTAVKSITIDKTNLPASLISGQSFELSVSFNPENATDQSYEWIISDPTIFANTGNTFHAAKPGSATISARSKDNPAATDTTSTIAVNLAQPKNISTMEETNSIQITWDPVNYANGYIVYRSDNNGDVKKIGETTDTAFEDKNNLFTNTNYVYSVKALASEKESQFDSALSETSAITIASPSISITWPVKGDFSNVKLESTRNSITPDYPSLKISASQSEDIANYYWTLNGTEIEGANGNYIDIDINTKGLKKGYQNYRNVVSMTIVTTSDEIYSTEIKFTVIDVLDTSVAVTSPIESNIVSSNLENGNGREIQLKGTVFPSNASIPDITYSSSNTDIATVDQYTGLVTFKPNASGDVTITARSYSGNESAITFTAYSNCITSNLELLNAVNSKLNQYFTEIIPSVDDWYTTFAHSYKSSDGLVTIHGQSDSVPHVYAHAEFKDIPVTLNGKTLYITSEYLGMEYYNYNSGLGAIGTDRLASVGNNNGKRVTVTLPDNQGTIYIDYESVNIKDATRSGSYYIEYAENVYAGFEPDEKLQSKETIIDSESVNRII